MTNVFFETATTLRPYFKPESRTFYRTSNTNKIWEMGLSGVPFNQDYNKIVETVLR